MPHSRLSDNAALALGDSQQSFMIDGHGEVSIAIIMGQQMRRRSTT